jgi:peptidoglycan-N-acetylglucosamine deacetylase
MASLTFDDGPDPRWTPRILDELRRAGVHATFFVMAGRACRAPELVSRTLSEGHQVELHCLDHVRHTEASRLRIERDTDEALRMLAPLTARPRRWRPPWGASAEWTAEVADARGLDLAGWTLDTEDWSGVDADQMLERCLAAGQADPVILLHDGLGPGARRDGCGPTAGLIAPLVRELRRRGTSFEPLADRAVALQ